MSETAKKILVVDDSLMDRKLLMSALKKNGIEREVLQAADGKEGLQVLNEFYQDIGLILLDWQMPNVDGIEFMQIMLQNPQMSRIPVIMITASGSEDSKKKAYQMNPALAGYVVKPYKPQSIITLVNDHLKG